MKIDLHIGRLVVDGAHGVDADALRTALADALAQRFADAPPALSGYAVPSLRATLAPNAASLGDGVAHALHGALAPGTPR